MYWLCRVYSRVVLQLREKGSETWIDMSRKSGAFWLFNQTMIGGPLKHFPLTVRLTEQNTNKQVPEHLQAAKAKQWHQGRKSCCKDEHAARLEISRAVNGPNSLGLLRLARLLLLLCTTDSPCLCIIWIWRILAPGFRLRASVSLSHDWQRHTTNNRCYEHTIAIVDSWKLLYKQGCVQRGPAPSAKGAAHTE